MKSANPDHWDFYNRYRRKMQDFSSSETGKKYAFTEFLLLGPDLLHLSLQLVKDKEVPARHKAKLAAAIAYFMSPLDLMPEVIFGPLGFLDDICIIAFVLNSLLNEVPEHIIARHWAGNQSAITVVRAIILAADRMLGKGLWQKLRRIFNRRELPSGLKNAN